MLLPVKPGPELMNFYSTFSKIVLACHALLTKCIFFLKKKNKKNTDVGYNFSKPQWMRSLYFHTV